MNIITSNFFLAVSRVKLVDEPNIAFSLVNEGKINSWIPDYIIKPFKKKKKKKGTGMVTSCNKQTAPQADQDSFRRSL